MRLFGVNGDDEFVEYEEQALREQYRETTIETWLESNPDCIVEDSSLLLIGRQVSTNLGTSIDLLGVDAEGDVAVVELKRDRTPRDTLAQALEYASFAAQLDYDQLEALYQAYVGDETAPPCTTMATLSEDSNSPPDQPLTRLSPPAAGPGRA